VRLAVREVADIFKLQRSGLELFGVSPMKYRGATRTARLGFAVTSANNAHISTSIASKWRKSRSDSLLQSMFSCNASPVMGDLNHARILRRPAVLERIGVSGSTLSRLIQAGKFPAPAAISTRTVGWDERDVESWIVAHFDHAEHEAAR
jgi:prophage regulatory protein